VQLDLTEEEAAALLSLKPGDRRRSLSVVAARQDAAQHSGEVPGGSARATTREATDARRTEPEASATLWSAAALGDLMTALRPCDDHISLAAAALGAD
jgi:hypothetical protein